MRYRVEPKDRRYHSLRARMDRFDLLGPRVYKGNGSNCWDRSCRYWPSTGPATQTFLLSSCNTSDPHNPIPLLNLACRCRTLLDHSPEVDSTDPLHTDNTSQRATPHDPRPPATGRRNMPASRRSGMSALPGVADSAGPDTPVCTPA